VHFDASKARTPAAALGEMRRESWPQDSFGEFVDDHFEADRALVETLATGGSHKVEKAAGLAQIIAVGVLDLLTEITSDGRKALADAERGGGRGAYAIKTGVARAFGQ
jgi:hypothetical protein